MENTNNNFSLAGVAESIIDTDSMYEVVSEPKKDNNPFNMAVPRVGNLSQQRKEATPCILVGRGENWAFMCMDIETLGVKAYQGSKDCPNMPKIEQGRFGSTMLFAAVRYIRMAVKQGKGIRIVGYDGNAVMYRTYRKIVKDTGSHDVDYIYDRMVDNKYFNNTENDTEELTSEKEAMSSAIHDFVEVMVEADMRGLFVEVTKASEFNRLTLNVPDGITLENGQVLTFKNGHTVDGITVNGWKNFNRDKAVVIAHTPKRGGVVYQLVEKNHLSREEQAIRNYLGQMWAKCPESVVKVTTIDASVATSEVAF